jgi:hypothetical protein
MTSDPANIKAWGAIGDGSSHPLSQFFGTLAAAQATYPLATSLSEEIDTVAARHAHATGRPIFYPYGVYLHRGYFPECEGGIIGEGWSAQYNSTASAQATRILFFDCTDTARASIKVKDTGQRSGTFRVQNVSLEASSWDPATGALGDGIRFQHTIHCENVTVYGFQGNGIVCEGAGSPYESRFIDVRSVYNGGHGMLLGTNANVITLINYQGKWNGASAFQTAPTGPGTNKHGLFTRIVGLVPSPEGLTVIGGDCSYNSGYGWNFEALAYSTNVCPGYAEFNFADYVVSPESRTEAHVGNDVYFCDIRFNKLRKPADPDVFPLTVTQSGLQRSFGTRVALGNKQVWPTVDTSLVTNPIEYDTTNENGGTYQKAPRRVVHLARSDNYTHFVRWQANLDPTGTDTDKVAEAVLSLIGSGTWSVNLGGPSVRIRLRNNAVDFLNLPDYADDTAAAAGGVAVGQCYRTGSAVKVRVS